MKCSYIIEAQRFRNCLGGAQSCLALLVAPPLSVTLLQYTICMGHLLICDSVAGSMKALV